MIDRIRKAWASFMSSFDYEPPRALAVTEPADTEIMEPLHPPDVQADLDRIATAGRNELPAVVTRRVMDWSTGVEICVPADRPLNKQLAESLPDQFNGWSPHE